MCEWSVSLVIEWKEWRRRSKETKKGTKIGTNSMHATRNSSTSSFLIPQPFPPFQQTHLQLLIIGSVGFYCGSGFTQRDTPNIYVRTTVPPTHIIKQGYCIIIPDTICTDCLPTSGACWNANGHVNGGRIPVNTDTNITTIVVACQMTTISLLISKSFIAVSVIDW